MLKQIAILTAALVNAVWYTGTIRPQYRTVIKKTRDTTFQEIAERKGIVVLCRFYEVTCQFETRYWADSDINTTLDGYFELPSRDAADRACIEYIHGCHLPRRRPAAEALAIEANRRGIAQKDVGLDV
ncbi:hypothetical protein C4901_11475 [Acidiferrobacter sp. SPIII_3]|nr:hypothetical protein C4901_11475 [Acidiferrobacter sp. SPIII_3]